MMTLREISNSASALGNQIRAGIALAEATDRLQLLQPKYAEFWLEVTKHIQAGRPLSEYLEKVWPESLVIAVKAGEESGSIEDVFKNIVDATNEQMKVRKELMKLVYPVAIILVAILVFIAIMIFVVPITTETFRDLRVGTDSVFTNLSEWMVEVASVYWPYILVAVIGGSIVAIQWLRSEEGRRAAMDVMLKVPLAGKALSEMAFGVWGRYMALMIKAGIGTIASLEGTVKILPESLRDGVMLFHRDLSVNNRSVGDSVDPNKQPDGDPRRAWPFYISTAFIVGERTEEFDKELLRVAPILIESATETLQRAIFIGVVVATSVAAGLLAITLLAVYLPLFGALMQVH